MFNISDKSKEVLIKRAKSFAWRTGAIVLMLAIGFVGENLGLLGLPGWMTVTVGLVLGEITKELNNRYDLERFMRRPTQS